MAPSWTQTVARLPSVLRRIFGTRFDKTPIQTADKLIEFIHSRSAYVAQTSLYGYLKTRMGTKFRYVFTDEKFLPSINHSKWLTYGACLSDLSIFAAATSAKGNRLEPKQIRDLAEYCFAMALERTFNDEASAGAIEQVREAFFARLDDVHWTDAAVGEAAFATSPQVLIDSAPIAEALKKEDREIVTNSIRFRWRDIREQLRKRIDEDAICADWLSKAGLDTSQNRQAQSTLRCLC